MSYDWVNNYIGLPYECNGRGPDVFDCYGLLKDVYKTQLNIDLPDWHVESTSEREALRVITASVNEATKHDFSVTDMPGDFDAAVIRHHNMANHVGVYINGGVLHTSRSTKRAVWEPVSSFIMSGKGQLEFYKWRK